MQHSQQPSFSSRHYLQKRATCPEARPKGDNWDIWLVEHFDWSPNYPMGVVFREFFGDSGGFRKMGNDAKFEGLQTKVLATTGKGAGKTDAGNGQVCL